MSNVINFVAYPQYADSTNRFVLKVIQTIVQIVLKKSQPIPSYFEHLGLYRLICRMVQLFRVLGHKPNTITKLARPKL